MGQLLAIIFFLLSALAVSLRKVYGQGAMIEPVTPAHAALKRRTVKSTKRENVLFFSLAGLAVLSFGLFVVMAQAYLNGLVYLFVVVLGLATVFYYLPNKTSGGLIIELSNFLEPLFIGLLIKTRKQTSAIERYLENRENVKIGPKRLTKIEILDFLNQQKSGYQGRNLGLDIAAAINLLAISSDHIEDHMVPLAEVHLIGDQETAGPILIDELHKSDRHFFPVNNKTDGIVGSVKLADLLDLSEGGRAIKDVVSSEVYYVEEENNLHSALVEFVSSGSPMFIVKNSHKNTGVLYVEDIVKKLLDD